MEAIGRLAGGIAHDFNNQLTVIQGYGAIARASTKSDDPTVIDCLTQIVSASKRSANLVRQLLTFSRKGRRNVTLVNVHTIIKETLDVLSHSLHKMINLTHEFNAEDAIIRGDAGLLQNAFLNLALNARDAMPQGGQLSFVTEVMNIDTPLITRLGSLEPGSYLLITVSDSGQGISEAAREHVFEPFFSTKLHGKGTGLGLASVYGTIKQHSGGIEVESREGQGTTFRLYLPRNAVYTNEP
jgi:signal transduction histidine kinase